MRVDKHSFHFDTALNSAMRAIYPLRLGFTKVSGRQNLVDDSEGNRHAHLHAYENMREMHIFS